MENKYLPNIFQQLQAAECIRETNVFDTADGFCLAYKSLAEILAAKGIADFCGADGSRRLCDRFFDDWFLYAVPSQSDYTYSLLKMREQEHDAQEEAPADGDIQYVNITGINYTLYKNTCQ